MLAEDAGLAGRLALDSFRQLAAVGCDEGTGRQVTTASARSAELELLVCSLPFHWPCPTCMVQVGSQPCSVAETGTLDSLQCASCSGRQAVKNLVYLALPLYQRDSAGGRVPAVSGGGQAPNGKDAAAGTRAADSDAASASESDSQGEDGEAGRAHGHDHARDGGVTLHGIVRRTAKLADDRRELRASPAPCNEGIMLVTAALPSQHCAVVCTQGSCKASGQHMSRCKRHILNDKAEHLHSCIPGASPKMAGEPHDGSSLNQLAPHNQAASCDQSVLRCAAGRIRWACSGWRRCASWPPWPAAWAGPPWGRTSPSCCGPCTASRRPPPATLMRCACVGHVLNGVRGALPDLRWL